MDQLDFVRSFKVTASVSPLLVQFHEKNSKQIAFPFSNLFSSSIYLNHYTLLHTCHYNHFLSNFMDNISSLCLLVQNFSFFGKLTTLTVCVTHNLRSVFNNLMNKEFRQILSLFYVISMLCEDKLR